MDRPVRLPRADQAWIPTEKLIGYALDPKHARGRHKARVFKSALGITAQHWRHLHDQILERLPTAAVRGTRITPCGTTYEVMIEIDGLNGCGAQLRQRAGKFNRFRSAKKRRCCRCFPPWPVGLP